MLSKAEQKAKFITGDYTDLKDFADKERIDYGYLREYAAKGKWLAARDKHHQQIANKRLASDEQNRVKTAIERQNATLNACDKLRTKVLGFMEEAKTSSDFNNLASALYRIKEVESDLLNYKGGNTNEAQERLKAVCDAIRGRTNGD